MRLHAVGRRYGVTGPWVLRGVDLDLPAGTLVRVEGANGSGKSTLLRLLAGIDAPSRGRIHGRPRGAYVPERFPGGLPFTALGYLTRMGRVHGLRRAAAAREAEEWLDRFGAAGHARTPMAALSKGSSQKVAVAQALLARPGLLVLDEAWTGLDQEAREVLDRAVGERVAAGGTVVLVDHHRRHGMAPDAVYRVADGRVVAVPPEEAVRETAGRKTAAREAPAVHAAPVAPAARDVRTVRIEAEGPPGAPPPPGLPGHPARRLLPDGGTAFTVPAARSDAALRALLDARPPWHIRALSPARPEDAAPAPAEGAAADRTPAAARGTGTGTGTGPGTGHGPGEEPRPRGRFGGLGALLRYRTALLLHGRRWLPPLLLYAAFLAIGVQRNQPVLDSLGYAAAVLVPVTAWLVRICVTDEPAAARHCAAAATGPGRDHLAAVLAGLLAAAVLGTAGTGFTVAVSDPRSTDRLTDVPLLPAAGAGLLAALACALLGTVAGALCNRPLLRSPGRAVPATVLAALLVVVVSGSPANAAVSGLVTGSRDGTVTFPWLPLAAAVLAGCAATWTASALAARRG